MKLSIIDTHAHLDMEPFRKDPADVIARALDAGVTRIVSIGTNLESSKRAIQLAENHTEVLAAVGFHPHGASRVKEEDIADLAKIADHPRVVAIGEAGLDFYRNLSPREAQLRVVQWQLDLAVKLGLPIIIHCRQAEKDMLPLLHHWTSAQKEPVKQPRGVIHCFMGDGDTAQEYLDMGFFLSLGAYIGYPSLSPMHNVIRQIPQDRLVVETDSPFLPPQSRRGQGNEPAFVLATIELIAEIREVSLEAVARETTQNAHRLFRMAQVQ